MAGGMCGRGHVWQGACMAGGHAWQGDGRMATAADSKHPTGCILVKYMNMNILHILRNGFLQITFQ